jgi:NDP-hexose-3-ketoreductase
MIRKINIGVLGCANIAERYMIPAINALNPYYNLIGIASRNQDKAIEFSEKFNTKSYNGYAELLNEPSLEAVYIPLPNALHAQWIESALGLGLHVLVEKSLASTYEDVSRLNEIANAKSLALVENFQFRFHSQLEFIHKLLSDGTFG